MPSPHELYDKAVELNRQSVGLLEGQNGIRWADKKMGSFKTKDQSGYLMPVEDARPCMT